MIRKFKPNLYVDSIHAIDFRKLVDMGIKCVYVDLDNTLVPHDVSLPTEEVVELIERIKQYHLKFVIVSNNRANRVSVFADALGVEYTSDSRKPMRKIYNALHNKYGFKPNEIAAIGDQLLTDVYGANRYGLYSILVAPIANKDILWTKFNRSFENLIYKRLEKKNLLKKGKFDV